MILIHACCAPCVSSIIKNMDEEFTVFWYNPNIHPYREYLRRMNTLEKLSREWNFKVIYDKTYNLQEWIEKTAILNKKSDVLRCRYCYADRLDRTARYAKEHGYRAFTTSLLYSPYQKHEIVKEIGENVSKKYGIEFYYRDFREFFPMGNEIAKSLGLYNQGYCGCIWSEFDRYGKSDSE